MFIILIPFLNPGIEDCGILRGRCQSTFSFGVDNVNSESALHADDKRRLEQILVCFLSLTVKNHDLVKHIIL